ncbi:hypothetical protein K3495_g2630 [Podosphaera aphanis]|nr:hypothetical protein K3495_g2630 [Podosphaera aphanis]
MSAIHRECLGALSPHPEFKGQRKRMRSPNKSTQIASSVATSAHATALLSRVTNSKAITADKAISILETHGSLYPMNSDNNTPQLVPSIHPGLCRLITEQTDRVIQKISEGVPAQSYATALDSILTPFKTRSECFSSCYKGTYHKTNCYYRLNENATGAEIFRETTRALRNPSASVIATRKVPSGEIHLTFASAAKKNLYENDTRFRFLFGPDGSVRSRRLTVVAHGIPTTAIDPIDLAATPAHLKLQNPL